MRIFVVRVNKGIRGSCKEAGVIGNNPGDDVVELLVESLGVLVGLDCGALADLGLLLLAPCLAVAAGADGFGGCCWLWLAPLEAALADSDADPSGNVPAASSFVVLLLSEFTV